jgi:hypothetical protein
MTDREFIKTLAENQIDPLEFITCYHVCKRKATECQAEVVHGFVVQLKINRHVML